MGKYFIDIEKDAQKHLAKIHRSGNKKDIKKIEIIFEELSNHPETGEGNPKPLKHNLIGFWSRRINLKDRIVYKIDNEKITITIVASKGHYNDK